MAGAKEPHAPAITIDMDGLLQRKKQVTRHDHCLTPDTD